MMHDAHTPSSGLGLCRMLAVFMMKGDGGSTVGCVVPLIETANGNVPPLRKES